MLHSVNNINNNEIKNTATVAGRNLDFLKDFDQIVLKYHFHRNRCFFNRWILYLTQIDKCILIPINVLINHNVIILVLNREGDVII